MAKKKKTDKKPNEFLNENVPDKKFTEKDEPLPEDEEE
jgi:hypothetical protein